MYRFVLVFVLERTSEDLKVEADGSYEIILSATPDDDGIIR